MAKSTQIRENLDLASKMATPTRLGVTIGKQFLGRPYIPFPWMLAVEKVLLQAIAKGNGRIIVNVPPQNGKTTTFGMLLAAWYLGMNPFDQVIFVAYNETYASSWGEKTRNLLKRYGGELFGVAVSNMKDSAKDWKMNNGIGGMISAGITGGITGNPGHLVLVDDVVKTMEEAGNPTTLEHHLEEFDGSISTRFQENTTVVIMATRWSETDLSGALIERQNQPGWKGDVYEVFNIPAIAEPDDEEDMTPEELAEWTDFLGRHVGEGLLGRFSQAYYEKKMATLQGGFTWTALYQGKPASRTGGMFPKEKWRWYSPASRPEMVRKVRVWDLATTEGGGDWTVGTLAGTDSESDLFLIDRQRFRRNPGDVETEVKRIAALDGYGVKIIIEQERAGAGKTVVEHYKRILPGYVVEPGNADGTKEQRATASSGMQNLGRWWLPDDQPEMTKEWVEEHRKMMGDGRRPRHDDQVDTSSYAALDLMSQGSVELIIGGGFDDPDGEWTEDGLWLPHEAQMQALLGQGIFAVGD